MRNFLFLIVLFVGMNGFSQERTIKKSYGLEYLATNFGPSFGFKYEATNVPFGSAIYDSWYVSGFFGSVFSHGTGRNDGTSNEVNFGFRNYLSKNKNFNGIYYQSTFIHYARNKFNDSNFEGIYSQFSFFNPTIGLKVRIGKASIDPSFGVLWAIQIKGKGDVDNIFYEVWQPRFSLNISFNRF